MNRHFLLYNVYYILIFSLIFNRYSVTRALAVSEHRYCHGQINHDRETRSCTVQSKRCSKRNERNRIILIRYPPFSLIYIIEISVQGVSSFRRININLMNTI